VLTQLEANQSRLQGQHRRDECAPVHRIQNVVQVLSYHNQVVQRPMLGAELVQGFSIWWEINKVYALARLTEDDDNRKKLKNVGHCHEKPRPLKRAEIRHIAFFRFNVADIHNLTENLGLGKTIHLSIGMKYEKNQQNDCT